MAKLPNRFVFNDDDGGGGCRFVDFSVCVYVKSGKT